MVVATVSKCLRGIHGELVPHSGVQEPSPGSCSALVVVSPLDPSQGVPVASPEISPWPSGSGSRGWMPSWLGCTQGIFQWGTQGCKPWKARMHVCEGECRCAGRWGDKVDSVGRDAESWWGWLLGPQKAWGAQGFCSV